MATLVVVQRRWPWQQEDFHSDSEGEIDIKVSSSGVLIVAGKRRVRSYASGQWKTVTSKIVPSRARV